MSSFLSSPCRAVLRLTYTGKAASSVLPLRPTARPFTMSAPPAGKHAPFKEVEASRAPFNRESRWEQRKTIQPDWKIGQGRNDHPQSEAFAANVKKTEIKPEEIDGGTAYKLLINGIVPRPIAFVSSEDSKGVRNLAPFSYFNAVSHNPPLISISVNCKGANAEKDTGANIVATKRFTVSIISEPFLEASNVTSIDAPADVSEWALSGLTPTPSSTWGGEGPPRVGESAYVLECELWQAIDIKNDDGVKTADLILGRVRNFVINDSVLNADKTIDPAKFLPVSRAGGITYGRFGDGCELPRPVWEKEKDKPEVVAALQKAKA